MRKGTRSAGRRRQPGVWIVLKVVNNSIIGCAVGPFETEQAAADYAEKAVIGGLGYEKWVIRELQRPSDL